VAVPPVSFRVARIFLAGDHRSVAHTGHLVEGAGGEGLGLSPEAAQHTSLFPVQAINFLEAIVIACGSGRRIFMIMALLVEATGRCLHCQLALALHDMIILAVLAVPLPYTRILPTVRIQGVRRIALAFLVECAGRRIHGLETPALYDMIILAVEAVCFVLASFLNTRCVARTILTVLVEFTVLVRDGHTSRTLDGCVVMALPSVILVVTWISIMLRELLTRRPLRERDLR